MATASRGEDRLQRAVAVALHMFLAIMEPAAPSGREAAARRSAQSSKRLSSKHFVKSAAVSRRSVRQSTRRKDLLDESDEENLKGAGLEFEEETEPLFAASANTNNIYEYESTHHGRATTA